MIKRNKQYLHLNTFTETLSTLYRIIQLASPNLNYLIMVGATLIYISIFLAEEPTIDILHVQINCIVS